MPRGFLRTSSSSRTGEKYLSYDPHHTGETGYLYTAVSDYEWGDYREVQTGERYASLTDHKIYEFSGDDYTPNLIFTLPVGASFFNKADNFFYLFDGTDFLKASNNPAADLSELIVAPVQGVVDSVKRDYKDYVTPSTIGETYIYLDAYSPDATLFTAISSDTWDEGVILPIGGRYASQADSKIYVLKKDRYDYTVADQFNVPVNVPFFNQADNFIYAYDGTRFVKAIDILPMPKGRGF